MIRITIPFHLCTLAGVNGELLLDIEPPVTIDSAISAVEQRYPMLRGTIRDHGTKKRRDFLRFFACGQDLSHEPPDTPLPEKVVTGEEPFMVVGAIAGG